MQINTPASKLIALLARLQRGGRHAYGMKCERDGTYTLTVDEQPQTLFSHQVDPQYPARLVKARHRSTRREDFART
jgi:hypothetical protein